jgi:hypothetical protein
MITYARTWRKKLLERDLVRQGAGKVSDQVTPAGAFRVVATSITLIAFTAVVGLACVLALSCTLSQARMSRITINGVVVSIWKLDDIRKHWSDIRQQIFQGQDNLAKAEMELDTAQKSLSKTEARYQPQKQALDKQLEAFNYRVRPFDADLANAISGKSFAEQIGRINAPDDKLTPHAAELQPLIERINEAYKVYDPLYVDSVRDTATVQAAEQKVKDITDHLASLQTTLDKMFSDFSAQPLDKPTRNRLEYALFELYSEAGPIGLILNKIITAPPDILTLGLVILMGVLGSALQMTHALFKDHRVEGPGAYCLRLSVGAITALVIFIVAKAGVPVIADASQLGGDAPINPYFISFLAIVSGLMSENAIVSVERQGQRFFAQDVPKEQPRWARYDLHDAFKKAERDPKAVQHLLNAEDDQFDAWISGKEAMPMNTQTMLAGVLGLPLRDIVTDLEPDDVAHTPASPP